MNIIVMGNPIDGLSFTGPFDNADDAGEYAVTEFTNEEWWIVFVKPPKEWWSVPSEHES